MAIVMRNTLDGLSGASAALGSTRRLRINGSRQVPMSSLIHWGSLLLLAGSIALWIESLSKVNTRRLSDTGLISVLPLSFFMALIILTISFCLLWHQEHLRVPFLLLHIILLIVILYGTPTLVEETTRNHVAWRHAGIAEYIIRTGGLQAQLDAYFDWPSFFILGAFITKVAGLQSPLSLTAWAPMCMDLLWLCPLVTLFRATTRNSHIVWLAVWFFYITDWVAQDYFSPQGFNFFLFLVIIAVLLRWFAPTSLLFPNPKFIARFPGFVKRKIAKVYLWIGSPSGGGSSSTPWQRVGLVGVIVSLFVVSISSHQLTPFFILAAVTVLVIFNRVTTRGMPLLMLTMLGMWIAYMTVAFLIGNIQGIIGELGSVNKVVDANVSRRVSGSQGHLLVVHAMVAMALSTWTLAMCGAIRRLRAGDRDLTPALLAGTPFSLLALQAYGGEMIFRVYLFSLPFVVFFVAALFCPTTFRPSWRAAASVILVSVPLLIGFFITRYGNERMDSFTENEVIAVQQLYRMADSGSLILDATQSFPAKAQRYEQLNYLDLPISIIASADVNATAALMESKQGGTAYLILTRSQAANVALLDGLPGSVDRLEEALKASRRFRVVYVNEDAIIFVLTLREPS